MKRITKKGAGMILSDRRSILLLIVVLLGCLNEARAGNAAFAGNHPLDEVQAGALLIHELRCAVCHQGLPSIEVPEKLAPDLSDVGSRVSPDFLQRYLETPAKAHPGTTMPDMLASRSAEERSRIAEALTHFLVSQSTNLFIAQATDAVDTQLGQALYHSVGCVACHGAKVSPPQAPAKSNPLLLFEDDDFDPQPDTGKQSIEPVAIALGHVAEKYSVKSLGDFLFQPLHVRASGRMPDMKLTAAEAMAIAGYLIDDASQRGALPLKVALEPEPQFVEQGKRYFEELRCAACHKSETFGPALQTVPMNAIDSSRGCLSKSDQTQVRFELSDSQVQAIVAALRAQTPVKSDTVTVAQTLVAFNCIGCHVRDDFGGVHQSHDPYFATSQEKLGEEGRIPPPLTLIGAKLQSTWLKKVLFDGESVRPYMSTRMPQYGEPNLSHLPPLLAKLDVLGDPELQIPSPESRSASQRELEKQFRAAGRELLGDKGLNCVACHRFNGKGGDDNQGIDLVTSYQRLQSAWFKRYLIQPGTFRPRTVMPTAWPDGEATFKTILDGDTDRQIEAIWYYLSLGTSAADPSGVRNIGTRLTVVGQPQTYRGRSRVAGFRGIAVGFPEQIHYAFNAETGSIAAIWLGDFVTVNWGGQGAGDFNPAGETIPFAQDVSFARLETEDSPWPLMPVMTKDARTNPDPLYPKNHGYQFLGYHFDQASIPTFEYRSGTVRIEDRCEVGRNDSQPILKRQFRFESPTAQSVWFRPLVGTIQQESETVYRSGQMRLVIPDVDVKLRPLSVGTSQQTELLLRLQIPAGQSMVELVYEPIKK